MNPFRKVDWVHYTTLPQVKQALANLPANKPIAADFEAASIYSKEEVVAAKDYREELDVPFRDPELVYLNQVTTSDGLSHPSLIQITHMSIATSEYDSFVIVFNPEIHEYVLNWIVTTEIKQIWHNLGYDGKLIRYFTGRFPKNYEDTQILAKTLINHCDISKALTGLKHLAGSVYGEWSIADELEFTEANKMDPKMLEYAAVDACATMYLYNDMKKQIKELNNEQPTEPALDVSTTTGSFSI